MRRFHRILGLVLVLPLLAWVATGVMFHVKHRYAEAYESLSVPTTDVDWTRATLSASEVLEREAMQPPITLAVHPSGVLAWFGATANGPLAVDAGTGARIEPATVDTARAWLRGAIERSPHAGRYGSEVGVREISARSSRTGAPDPAFVFETSGGKRVTVDRVTGEIRQTGDLNDFIDASYDVHYLKWTPWPEANVALVLVGMASVIALALTGLRLFLARR